MRHLLISTLIFGVFQIVAVAQNSTEKTGCPVFSVFGPNSVVDYDKPIKFRLDIDKKLSPNVKINWTVSYGKILSGQGTEAIEIGNLLETGRESIATVELIGLPENCQKTASASHIFCRIEILSEKVDEFGKITRKSLAEKIINLSEKLKADPTATAIIVKSFAKNTNKSEAYRNLQLMLDLLKSNGISEERIVFQTTFANDEINELWFIPVGATPPTPEGKYESFDVAELEQKIKESSKRK